MTANVTVTVAQKANVLRIPNAAITTRGNVSTVRIMSATNKQQTVVVTAGLKGDNFTEIQNGLSATDHVVVSTASAGTVGTTGTGARLGGGLGGIGGGLGGGGGGLGGAGVRGGG
jgi:multidrug efflux pump subunit AcrA (membrane-fusion protein)